MPRRPTLTLALGLALVLLPLQAGADTDPPLTKTDNVTPVAHFPFHAGSEIDYDGERYLFAGQANLNAALQRQDVAEGQDSGVKIIDLQTMRMVGELDCPGTDNYVRYLDPGVFNTPQGDREFVAVAHHGNLCTRDCSPTTPTRDRATGRSTG